MKFCECKYTNKIAHIRQAYCQMCAHYVLTQKLQALIDCTAKYIKLLLACKLDEVYGIARNADCKLRILLRMLHCIDKKFAVEYIHVEVMTTVWSEIAVEQVHQIAHLCCIVLAKS